MKTEEKNRRRVPHSGKKTQSRAGVNKKRHPVSSGAGKMPARSRRTGTGASGAERHETRRASGPVRRPAAAPVRRRSIPTPDVVYTPGMAFERRKLVLHLATVVAVVLALAGVLALFFKVRKITISGNDKYNSWSIREASGIQEGNSLLGIGKAGVSGRIQAALPYVDKVRIGIKLPDTVNIEIEETDMVYAIQAHDETWWLMTAEGRIVEQTDKSAAEEKTRILGVTLAVPVGSQAAAYEASGQNAFGDTMPAVVNVHEQLRTALDILQNLEMNRVFDQVTEVDVSNPENLRMKFRDKYLIKLGDKSRMNMKIDSMMAVFEQESFLEAGSVDVSFTDRPNQVVFTPFQ